MKKRWMLAALLLAAMGVQAGELRLGLDGKGIAGNQIRVAVYAAAAQEQFPSGKFYREAVSDTAADRVSVIVPDLPPGRYAVAVYADRNRNGKLDKNFVGMPTEPCGFSNNARASFGPPGFSDAAFEVEAGSVTQSIHLR